MPPGVENKNCHVIEVWVPKVIVQRKNKHKNTMESRSLKMRNGRTYGRTDGHTDVRTNSYKDATSHLIHGDLLEIAFTPMRSRKLCTVGGRLNQQQLKDTYFGVHAEDNNTFRGCNRRVCTLQTRMQECLTSSSGDWACKFCAWEDIYTILIITILLCANKS